MQRTPRFFRDESGSVSIWNLFWLLSFCGLLGLAVDVTTAMNTKARLQAVADASTHAGVMDISPTPMDSVITAVEFSYENIPNINKVVTTGDVVVGWWDHNTKTFDPTRTDKVNAVQVLATRDTARSNATDTTFLGVIGFNAWDIAAIATAAPIETSKIRCRANGLFAGGTAEQTSNNTIRAPYCVYGETSFKISQNNLIQCGVELIAPSPDHFHNGTPPVPTTGACNENYGSLSNDDMVAQAFVYDKLPVTAQLEYDNAKAILTKFINGESYNDPYGVIPPYITTVSNVSVTQFNNDAKKGDLVPGTLYNVTCSNNGKNLVPSGIVQNIGIYTNCEIRTAKDKDVSAQKPTKTETGKSATCDPDNSACSNIDWIAEIEENRWSCAAAVAGGFETYPTIFDTTGTNTYRDGVTKDLVAETCGIEPGANGVWDNVMIFTTYLEGENVSQKAMTLPNNMQLGRIDGCTEGGGVRIYSAGSVDTPSGTTAHGVQIVTLGSVQFAAKANGAMGLTITAEGDIKYTANGLMGGCDPDDNAGESEVVVTVRPISLVQ